MLKYGDRITVYALSEKPASLKPEPIPLDIVFESQDLLIINKQPSMAVHPNGGITTGTLANGIAFYFQKNGLKVKVRPVNRLDYGTSGLIIFAKNAPAQAKISREIQEHHIEQHLLCGSQRDF